MHIHPSPAAVRRQLAFHLSLLLIPSLLLSTGCGRSNQKRLPISATPGKAVSGKQFKVAVILSGSETDHGWNQDAVTAMQAVQQKLNLPAADVSIKEMATTPEEQKNNLEAYADLGYNVVIGHGEEYQAPALQMAPDYPNTMFVISSGDKVASNVAPIVFKLEDGAYLLGMLAGGMSKAGIVGSVGAQAIAPVKSVFTAFKLGAMAANPNIKVLDPVYTNDWEDVDKAKEATLPLIQEGADVIIQDLDSASQGVFNAVEQSSTPSHPVYALGTNNDQNSAAPGVVLASAPIYCTPVFESICQQVELGTFKPSVVPYGLPQGVIGFVINPALQAKIPASLLQKLTTAEAQIKSGSLKVPMAGE